jgi:hypothetical protein
MSCLGFLVSNCCFSHLAPYIATALPERDPMQDDQFLDVGVYPRSMAHISTFTGRKT